MCCRPASDEFAALFNTILINVTAFFRDPEAWEFVADRRHSAVAGRAWPNDPIRVWSAGCASGQEAYTLAMLLAEAMGAEAFRQRVKIYATDIDEEALAEARAGYVRREGRRIGAARICWSKYFERSTGVTSSTRICAALSSSVATTWSRTRRFPGWTCWCAATH